LSQILGMSGHECWGCSVSPRWGERFKAWSWLRCVSVVGLRPKSILSFRSARLIQRSKKAMKFCRQAMPLCGIALRSWRNSAPSRPTHGAAPVRKMPPAAHQRCRRQRSRRPTLRARRLARRLAGDAGRVGSYVPGPSFGSSRYVACFASDEPLGQSRRLFRRPLMPYPPVPRASFHVPRT
jgi:hypothetical protein